MKDRFRKSDGVVFGLAIVGLVGFLFLYPRLFPEAAIRLNMDKEEIVEEGTTLVKNLGYDLDGYHRVLQLEHEADQIRYLNRAFGSVQANRLMSDSLPVFRWFLRWSSEQESSIQIGASGEEEAREALENWYGDVRLFVDLRGRPVEFEFRLREEEEENLPERVVQPEAADRRMAEELAETLIEQYGGTWSFEESAERTNQRGIVREYRWCQREKVAGEEVFLEVSVQDGRIQGFERKFTIPQPFSESRERDDWEGVVVVVLFLLLFILGVIYFVQRLRSDLMDLKSGLVLGAFVFLGWLVHYWTQVSSASGEPGWAMMIGFVITAPFVGGGIWALFSVGESLTREVWSEKLATLDTMRRKILFPGLGLALFRGVALACGGLGLLALLDYVGVRVLLGYYTLGDSPLYFWTSRWPSLFAVSRSLLSSLYIVVTFCLFLFTVLRRRLNKIVWVLPILFLFWSFVSFPVPRLLPFTLRMSVNGLVGLLFAWFFLRYEFVTVATGAVVLPILFDGVSALNVGSGFFFLHGLVLVGLVGVILLLAIFAYRGEAPSGEVVAYVPDYLQRIYERERIQRELEIARNVQLSFLPRTTPRVEGVDVATFCLPAKEVGGDYYDFIEVGPRRLGVVIGDVSGKGISAAFYMTLTKGFLKSQARRVVSTREVLINMNELFYENAERGIFISMIYGIFDLNARTLTFARAGHNPMILRRSGKGTAEELCPSGIGLGLEGGEVFARTVEERTIGIEKNDVFLFYTDGLNEAQNPFQEEFGAERLLRLIEENDHLSAEALLQKIQEEIQSFTAGAPQYDDMTAVVVKVL